MVSELDIWRSAQLLLKRHGPDAWFVASQRADALLEKGNTDGFHAWVRIGRAIKKLEQETPTSGANVN